MADYTASLHKPINTAEITLDNLYSISVPVSLRIVFGYIFPYQVDETVLQFQNGNPDRVKTVRQNKRNYPTTTAKVQYPGIRTQFHEMGQQHRIEGKPVSALMLPAYQTAVKKGVLRVFLRHIATLFPVFKWTT